MATATVAELPGAGLDDRRAPFRVAEREQDTADTWTLTLEPLAGPGPLVGPGQFMMVYAFGIGEVPISVSGPPGRPGPVVLTVRAVGAVTRAICASEPGTVLGLRGPFGTPWPVDAAAAATSSSSPAGSGSRRSARSSCTRSRSAPATEPSTVLYGARTPDDLLYTSIFDAWRRSDRRRRDGRHGRRGLARAGRVVAKLVPARASSAPSGRRRSSAGPRS